MSAFGPERTSASALHMSAFGDKAVPRDLDLAALLTRTAATLV